jgi:putative oxidoreductase
MSNFLSSRFISTDFALLFFRVLSGSMILFGHGVSKLERFNDDPIRFGDPIGIGTLPSLILAALAEVICAGLVIAGFKTRYALIPLIITMLVAAGITHLDDPWGKKELAVMYFIAFFTLFLTGPGKYSVDYRSQRSSTKSEETIK